MEREKVYHMNLKYIREYEHFWFIEASLKLNTQFQENIYNIKDYHTSDTTQRN